MTEGSDTVKTVEKTQRIPTMQMAAQTDNVTINAPDTPVDMEKLGIDEFLVDRLTVKPPEKYRIKRSIACGGMKMILEARDMDTMRNVAMAILPDSKKRPPAEVLHFIREARLTASLEHPNIIPIHDIGIDSSGSPYFTMKLLRGNTLSAMLKDMRTQNKNDNESLHNLLQIFLKICSGMAFAHSKGVLHLDLKPDNIQLGNFGEVSIIDWGLAKMIKPDGENPDPPKETLDVLANLDKNLRGTPGYMAPEQISVEYGTPDERTDVYSLGCILYAMLTLLDPVPKSEIKEMLYQTLENRIEPPHIRTPYRNIPAALEAVVLKAMSVDQNNRYASVKELRDEIRAYTGGYATRAEKASSFKKTWLYMARHRVLFLAGAIFLITAVIITPLQIREHYRRSTAWIPLCQQTFEKDSSFPENFSFYDLHGIPVKQQDKSTAGQSMYLKYPLTQNWRLVLTVKIKQNSSFSIVFRTALPREDNMFSAGSIHCLLNSPGTGRDLFYVKEADGKLRPLTSCLPLLDPSSDQPQQITFSCTDGKFTCTSGSGKICFSAFLPPENEENNCICISPAGADICISRLNIETKRLAERTTPVAAADAVLEEHLYQKAYERYMNILHVYRKSPFYSRALVSTYAIASVYGDDKIQDRKEKMADLKKMIVQLPKFQYKVKIHEYDCARMWLDGNYMGAMQIAERILMEEPENDILLCLPLLRRVKLSAMECTCYAALLHKMRGLSSLDISGMGFTTLTGLRGLRLEYLNCAGNDIHSPAGIENQPLKMVVTSNGVYYGVPGPAAWKGQK